MNGSNVEVIRLPYLMFSSVRNQRRAVLERKFIDYYSKREKAIKKGEHLTNFYFNKRILSYIAYIFSYYGDILPNEGGRFRILCTDEKAKKAFNALMEPSSQTSVFLSNALQIEAFSEVLGSLYMQAFLEKVLITKTSQFRRYVSEMKEAFSVISTIINHAEQKGIEIELMYSLHLSPTNFSSVFSSFVHKPKILLLKIISNNEGFMAMLPKTSNLQKIGQYYIYDAMISKNCGGKSEITQLQ